MLYPPEFLDEYFTGTDKDDLTEINTQLAEDAFKIAEQENKNQIY
jgi:hypothetical protein